MTINEAAVIAHANSRAKGFYDVEPRNIPEMLALIHSEVSEALECDRKSKKIWYNPAPLAEIEGEQFEEVFERDVKDTFADELADIVIRVMDLAVYKGVDLEKHIELKMRYNATRPHKHGKMY